MEFLKTCDTNAQAIGDFEAVAFQAFTVKRNPTLHPTKPFEWAASEDIRAVEAELRKEQLFVVQDASRPWLWLFWSTTTDQLGQKPLDLPPLDGYSLQREQFGVMKASELARHPMRNMNQTASTSDSTNSPSTPIPMKREQGGGGRLAQATPQPNSSRDQQQSHDSCSIYELFTSSVAALVSYHLVKDHNAVALNYRTFVSKPTADQHPGSREAHFPDPPYWLTNVTVLWASSGTLVVSIFSVVKPDIHCLGEIPTDDIERQCLGNCVRVAPNGILAKIVSLDNPPDTAVENVNQRPRRKRVKMGPVEQSIERWKSTVARWLTWKGYSIPNLDKRSSWVRIRIAHDKPIMLPSPGVSNQSRELLWPRALCFSYGDSLYPPALASRGSDALSWYETPRSAGFRDPIDSAQHWFLRKPEREKVWEMRRRAKKAEEEAARPKEENPGLYPSSPLNSRTGAYGDLQAVSGVYPTPPDGILPGTVNTPSISGVMANTLLVPGGNNPAINLLGPQDNAPSDGLQQPPTSPEFSQPFDQFNSSGGNDDLFEDMDEDGFDGNGVAEDDFDFFDEPEEDDIDMLDAPSFPEIKSTPKAAKEKQPIPILHADTKEDSSDPLAALEDALATVSGLVEETTQLPNKEQHAQAETSVKSNPTDILEAHPTSSESQITHTASKEPMPPLSPHYIQKTLFPSPKDKPAPKSPPSQANMGHRDSIFDPVAFNQKMTLSDAKYQAGRFSFMPETQPSGGEVFKANQCPASLRNIPLLIKPGYAIGMAATRGIPEITSLARPYSDDSDSASEVSSVIEEESDDDISIGPEPLPSGFVLSGKRKLPTDGNATPMSVTSYAESFGGEGWEIIGLQTDESSLGLFEPSPWDWSLTNVPAPIEMPMTGGTRFSVPSFSPIVSSMPNTPTSQPDLIIEPPDEKPLSAKDNIAVAQIVTDQVVLATLDISPETSTSGLDIMSSRSYTEDKLQTVVRRIFPKATECNVLALISVHDVFPDVPHQVKGQPRPPPRRVNDLPATPGYHMLAITPPHIRVRRADSLWDLLPPALAFWEPLGLSPCSPAKNVVPFCLYPYSESLKPCVENFLVNTQLAYENCKLGTHARVDTIPDYEGDIRGGLVPCKIGAATSVRTAYKALRDSSVQLGKLLAAKHTQMREKDEAQKTHKKIDAFVIYMIDPLDSPSAIWELCSAFWTLFQAYGPGPPGRADAVSKPDLVLQIVPIKYVASFEVPVILDSNTYAALAREVYDRCPPSSPSEDKTPLSIYSAPCFQLEESIPRTIPFKLNAEPPQDLLRESSYLHLGYAISLDGTWITTAWTDSCGKSQAVVSYNLGTRPFHDIAKEMWQTTVEILQARRVTWRVCIAKAGVLDREELETWISLATCPTQLNLFITLLTVDTNPPLTLTPILPANPASNTTTANPSANTPGSTPQPGTSPEPHGLTPANNPSAEQAVDPTADPDARFVDATDESWGVILAHRLHNSNSTVDFRPCLVSGLLVKRGSPTIPDPDASHFIPDPERGPIVIGINILWVGAVGSTRVATSPFLPAGAEGVSPGGAGASPISERNSTSLIWALTPTSRNTAENLMREVLSQFRNLGVLGKLKGMRGTRGGTIPWHVAAAMRGVEGLSRCLC